MDQSQSVINKHVITQCLAHYGATLLESANMIETCNCTR